MSVTQFSVSSCGECHTGLMRRDRMSDRSAEASGADGGGTKEKQALRIYTLGHSTLSMDDFLELLRHYGIDLSLIHI